MPNQLDHANWGRNTVFNKHIPVTENCSQAKMPKLEEFDMTKQVKVIHSLV